MIKNISNLGDAALYCDFGQEVNKDNNNQVIKYFKSIQKKNIRGVNNLIPSYNKLIVSFDLRKTNFQNRNKCLCILSFASSVVVPALKIKLQSEDSERSNSLAACFKSLGDKSFLKFLEHKSTKIEPAFVISGTIHAFVSLIQ